MSMTSATSSSSEHLTLPNPVQPKPMTAVPGSQSSKKPRNICLSILYGTIGTVCVVAAVVFALMAALVIGAAIFAAVSGGGPAGLLAGGIGTAIFAGLTFASVVISIYYFRKI